MSGKLSLPESVIKFRGVMEMLNQNGISSTHVVTELEHKSFEVYEESQSIIVKFLLAVTIAACTIVTFASVLSLFTLSWANNFSPVIGFLP